MSKITVTTIAGATSGADANKVKIESGDTLEVTSNATVGGDLTVDTNVLKVDSSNNRVGIGTASPLSDLHQDIGLTEREGHHLYYGTDAKAAFTVLPNTGEIRIGAATAGTSGNYNTEIMSRNGSNLITSIKADAYGRVTKPSQPSFSARGQDANWRAVSGTGSTWAGIGGTTYSSTSGNYQQGTNFTTSGHYGARNIGNHFVNSTAIFTAPVAGHYFFQIRMYLNRLNTASPGIYLNPRINSTVTDGTGVGIQGSYLFERTTQGLNANNAYIPFGREDIYYMAANDTFTYALNPEAAGFQIYGQYTEFKGYLIG